MKYRNLKTSNDSILQTGAKVAVGAYIVIQLLVVMAIALFGVGMIFALL